MSRCRLEALPRAGPGERGGAEVHAAQRGPGLRQAGLRVVVLEHGGERRHQGEQVLGVDRGRGLAEQGGVAVGGGAELGVLQEAVPVQDVRVAVRPFGKVLSEQHQSPIQIRVVELKTLEHHFYHKGYVVEANP